MITIDERSTGADVYAGCVEPRTGASSEQALQYQVKKAGSLSEIIYFLKPTDDPCHNRDIEAALKGLIDKSDYDPQFLITHARQLRKLLSEIQEKTVDFEDIQRLVISVRSRITYALSYSKE